MAEKDTIDELRGLSTEELRQRLACTHWQSANFYISDEQTFTLFRLAREAGDKSRVGVVSSAISARILARSTNFVRRNGIVPTLIAEVKEAAEELAEYIWDKVLGSQANAKHVEIAFGQFFDRRAIDFHRHLRAKKRTMQESLDALDHIEGSEDSAVAENYLQELQDPYTPEDSLHQKQKRKKVRTAMEKVLTRREFNVISLLIFVEMPVKDVADVLDVTPRTILNLRIQALKKLGKELAQ